MESAAFAAGCPPPKTANMTKDTLKRILITVAAALGPAAAFSCTSAIISAMASASGRPILWKHRDTSNIDNTVEYIAPTGEGYGYVALFNAQDRNHLEAWMGMNDVGFAVMNTASYNIKDDNVPAKKMDKEGIVMTKALRTCRTVDDFARLLETWPRPMGVEANFGVIDAEGNGAFFETNNHEFKRYDLADEPSGVLVRANYSHSGRKGEGYGYVREADAECLLKPYTEARSVTSEVLTEVLSRTFYHDGRKRDYTFSEDHHLLDEDFIPRYKSTATVAIEGCVPIADASSVEAGDLKEEYIMWTGLGYPPVSEIRAVRCYDGGVDEDLRGSLPNGHSPLADEAKRKRNDVFTVAKGGKKQYIDMGKLYNAEGTGYAQKVMPLNAETYRRETERRDAAKK